MFISPASSNFPCLKVNNPRVRSTWNCCKIYGSDSSLQTLSSVRTKNTSNVSCITSEFPHLHKPKNIRRYTINCINYINELYKQNHEPIEAKLKLMPSHLTNVNISSLIKSQRQLAIFISEIIKIKFIFKCSITIRTLIWGSQSTKGNKYLMSTSNVSGTILGIQHVRCQPTSLFHWEKFRFREPKILLTQDQNK